MERHGGWCDARLLVSFGTPYRGAPKALDVLANGLTGKLAPLRLLGLEPFARSLTSLYQLLPIYPCVDLGNGTYRHVRDAGSLGALDMDEPKPPSDSTETSKTP